MREILFRGKRKDNNGWITGSLVQFPDIIKIKDKNGIFGFIVDSETVGQFTGLTDRTGKKIFEGDILSSNQYPYTSDGKHNYYAEVTWFEKNAAFGLYTFKNPQSSVRGASEGSDYIDEFNSDDWEIIGNIYDSPELFGE